MATTDKSESRDVKPETKLTAVPAPVPAPSRANAIRSGTKQSISPFRPSKSSSARGASCGLARTPRPRRCGWCPRDRWGWTSRSAWGGCPVAASSRSTVPNRPARRRWRCTWWPRPRRRRGICAFVDAEHALDVGYARKLGVRTDDLLVSQPDCGEQALEITEMLVRSGAVDVIVVDSVAALTPRAELEGEMGDSHMGLQARLMSQALRKLTGTISKSCTLVIFINQIRMKIGVMFGNPETTTGGNALKFYASVRMDIRRVGALKDGEKVVGNRTRVKVVKNKMAAPFKEVEFDILYGEGISHEGDLVDLGAECGAVEKSGAWFGFEGERIGQGRENAKQFLRDHPDVARRIEVKVLAHHGVRRDPGGTGTADSQAGGGGGTVHALVAQPKQSAEKKR